MRVLVDSQIATFHDRGYATVIIGEIRQLLEARPFEPFSVLTIGGKEYRVATADHADISPTGNRLVIWFDDESSITLSGLHITSVHEAAEESG